MIGYISGKVTAVEENKVTLENNGIGFEIICSAAALERLGNEKSGGVFTYLQMKEDGLGLDAIDLRLLNSMIDKFGGGPVGLETLAAMINEDKNTLEDVYEPYLLQLGFISRSPRGRICTAKAYEYLGKKMPKKNKNQISVFDDD